MSKYRCTYPNCDKTFKWKSNMRVHYRTHNDTRQRTFRCDWDNCDRVLFYFIIYRHFMINNI